MNYELVKFKSGKFGVRTWLPDEPGRDWRFQNFLPEGNKLDWFEKSIECEADESTARLRLKKLKDIDRAIEIAKAAEEDIGEPYVPQKPNTN